MSEQQQIVSEDMDEISVSEERLDAADEDMATAEESSAENEPAEPEPIRVQLSGPAPWALGLWDILSTIVIVAATVYGYLAATTDNYNPLLMIDHFRQLGPQALNTLTLVGGSIAILTLLGAMGLARALEPSRRQSHEAQRLVTRISSLDLEREEGWMDEDLRSDPGIDRFLAGTLGAYRLLQTRLTKYVSLEGELFRLEKSLADGERIDLETKYDHPGAGRLASSLAKLYDQREKMLRDTAEAKTDLSESGAQLCNGVAEAVGWTSSMLDQINLQAESVGMLGRAGAEVSQEMRQLAKRQESGGAGQELLAQIRGDLTSLPNSDSSLALSAATGTIKDLVARGGKLAIQSAMEVARLGDRAGQLTGMSQELQDLITEFRAVATQLESLSGNQAKYSAVLTDTRRKLEGFNPGTETGQGLREMAERVESLQGDLGTTATQIERIAGTFNAQAGRLDRLGNAWSEATGAAYTVQTESAVEGEVADMDVHRFDPFSDDASGPGSDKPARSEAPGKQAMPNDESTSFASLSPFGAAEEKDETAQPAPGLDIETFEGGTADSVSPVVPAAGTLPQAGLVEPEYSMDLDLPATGSATDSVETDGIDLSAGKAEPAEPLEPTGPAASIETADEELSRAEERVYDLGEFDAVPLGEEEPAGQEKSERIYELAEFGAVPVT